jgi:hypothetical protein
MAVTPKCLVEPVLLTTANVNYYTVGKGATIIDKMTVINVTAFDDVITIYLVPSGGSAGSSNRIARNLRIAPDETYEFSKVEGHILNIGDSIMAVAGNASALSFRVSGREVAL